MLIALSWSVGEFGNGWGRHPYLPSGRRGFLRFTQPNGADYTRFSGCLKWGFAVNCADFCERDGAGWGMAGQPKNDTA
ncbi:MAG: hypothetical protein ACFNPX_00490 [Neisseria subflava]